MMNKEFNVGLDPTADFPGTLHQYYYEGYSLPAMRMKRTTVEAPPLFIKKSFLSAALLMSVLRSL